MYKKTGTKGKDRFVRFYMGLSEFKEGFRVGCRRAIDLGGCLLRGLHTGILLSVVGVDPNNSLYPLVFVVVEVENKATWK